MDTPWHLWLIGLFALIWTGFGAADYLMSQYQYAPYLAMFTEEQRSFFNGLPQWVQATWALAVWLSVAGAFMLLVQSKTAGLLFGLALLPMVATFAHNFWLASPPIQNTLGDGAMIFAGVTFCIAVLFWLYARSMRWSGHLD